MKKHIFIPIIFILISISACKQEIFVEIEQKPPKLVLNSVITTGDTIRINVSKSSDISMSFNQAYFVNDAHVDLYENGIFKNSMQIEKNGFYVSNTIAEPNKTYEFKVYKSGFDTAYAKINFPEEPKNINISTEDFAGYYSSWNNSIDYSDGKIKVDFESEDNEYFLFRATRDIYDYVYNNEGDITDSFKVEITFYGSLTGLPEDAYQYYYMNGSDYWLINLSRLQTSKASFVLNINSYTYYKSMETKQNEIKTDTINIEIMSISKDFYLYIISKDKYDDAMYNFMAEPVNVYTNVENGFGIIAAANRVKMKIPVEVEVSSFDY